MQLFDKSCWTNTRLQLHFSMHLTFRPMHVVPHHPQWCANPLQASHCRHPCGRGGSPPDCHYGTCTRSTAAHWIGNHASLAECVDRRTPGNWPLDPPAHWPAEHREVQPDPVKCAHSWHRCTDDTTDAAPERRPCCRNCHRIACNWPPPLRSNWTPRVGNHVLWCHSSSSALDKVLLGSGIPRCIFHQVAANWRSLRRLHRCCSDSNAWSLCDCSPSLWFHHIHNSWVAAAPVPAQLVAHHKHGAHSNRHIRRYGRKRPPASRRWC